MTDDRPRGRPRSAAAHQAILDATVAELRERGYPALTIEGIAGRAGVGKQTIYRWWSSKADVVLDALLDVTSTKITVPDKGSLSDDLIAFLRATFRQRGQRAVLVGLMAEAILDPAFATQFRDRFLFSRRAALRGILHRAAQRGEVAAELDLELLIDLVYGVLWYRLLLEHAPLSEDAGQQLAALVVRAVRPV